MTSHTINHNLETFLAGQIQTLHNLFKNLQDAHFFKKEQQLFNRFTLKIPKLNIAAARLNKTVTSENAHKLSLDIGYDGSCELMTLKKHNIDNHICYEEHLWSDNTLRVHTRYEGELSSEAKHTIVQEVAKVMNSLEAMAERVGWHNQRVLDSFTRHREAVELRSGILKIRPKKKGLFDFPFAKKSPFKELA